MLKHVLVGALTLSSLAFAGPHGSKPITPQREQVRGNDDRFDVMQGRNLLREFDSATARRDFRALQLIDSRFQGFMHAELRELGNRGDRQLRSLQSQLTALTGRYDPRSIQARRRVFTEAVRIAESDFRDTRFGRR